MNPNFSPADSLLSAPGDCYNPLFQSDATVAPSDTALVMTPQSFKSEFSRDSSECPSQANVDSENRPTKKRKSWGQELPTPKTNLPPRKRAKTEDEKEQRRIERVLRNRAAAHSSRERKRKEVEGLESEKHVIERENVMLKSQNEKLAEQVARLSAEMAAFRQMMGQSLPTAEAVVPSPILSVSSQQPTLQVKQELDDLEFSAPPPQATVDPRDSSLSSPSDSPVIHPTTSASDMTQHPAEMLCDLQCQSEAPKSWDSQQHLAFLTVLSTLNQALFLTMASTTYSLLTLPLLQIFSSLKTGSPLSLPTATPLGSSPLFPLIRWLISTPRNPLKTNTTSASTATKPTFRFSLLQRLLACSPALARPLRAATGRALQLMSDDSRAMRMGGFQLLSSTDNVNGYAEFNSLVTMMFAIDSILKKSTGSDTNQKSKPSTSAYLEDNRSGDPSHEVRRLCIALDEFFERRRGVTVVWMERIILYGVLTGL